MEEKLKEIRTKLVPVRVSLACPNKDCVMGMLEATGEMNPTNPPLYFHICDVCGHFEKIRGKKYPYIDYEPVIE